MEVTLKQYVYRIYAKYIGVIFVFSVFMLILYIFMLETGIAIKPAGTGAAVFANESMGEIFRDIHQIYISIYALCFLYILHRINRDLNNLAGAELGVILAAIDKQKFGEKCLTSEFETIRLSLKKTAEERDFEMAKNKETDEYMKRQIAFINHDIKTPISIIKSSAGLIKKDIGSDKTSDKTGERLQRIISQTDVAANYLDELQSLIECFKLSKNGEKLYTASEIAQWTEKISRLHADMLETNLVVHISPEISSLEGGIIIDLRKLEKSLVHILNNAARHRRKNPVGVDLYPQSGRLHISVTDDGEGFPGADFESPKELFNTSNTARTSGMGYGIGLYYVDTYLTVIGGSLLLENTDQQAGAKVTIQLEVVK